MAAAQRTTEQLVTAVRQLANQETPNPTTSFVTDTEIIRRIVEAQYELYDMMLEADPHIFVTPYSYAVAAGAALDLTTIPGTGFYRMVGLDLFTGGPLPVSVHRFNWAERNRYVGSNPSGTYTLWYTPRVTELVPGAVLDIFTDNYQKWIISAAAAVIMAKAEESDPSSVLADKATEGMRILGAIAARNSEPDQVPDISERDYYGRGFAQLPSIGYSIEGSSLMIRGGGAGSVILTSVPLVSGPSFTFAVATVADLVAYNDAALITGQAEARVVSPGRNYWLLANTGNPDDSTTTANFVNAPSGRQWVGE